MCWNCLGQGCPECMPSAFPKPSPCPDCDDGNKYYIIDPKSGEFIPCTKEDYDNTPEDYRDYEPCPTCNGEGVIYD